MAVGARGDRLDTDEQVRRGLPGEALLRRLRGRRRDGGAGPRPRQVAVRGRARERPAARGSPGEHGGVLRRASAGRPGARALAGSRRSSDTWAESEFLREALRVPSLRRLARDDDGRLRRGAREGQGGSAEADRLRRLGLPADGRGRPVPRDRRRGGGDADDRYGPFRGPGRGRAASEPGAALAFRHLDDAQDARRPARRVRALHRGARAGGRPRALPRHAGRAADAHDRGEGGVLPRRRHRRLP